MAECDDKPVRGSARNNLSSTCQERRIKVQAIRYTQSFKDPDHPDKTHCVPWIRMQGRWLQQAGFVINAPVKVRVMHGCVVLTIED